MKNVKVNVMITVSHCCIRATQQVSGKWQFWGVITQ